MRLAGSMGSVVEQLKAGRSQDDQVDEWISNLFNAHSLARGRPAVYMRRMVTKYIELLIESGDELFRRNTMESIPLALQRYVQASHLFGPAPRALPPTTKGTVKTYSQLFKRLNDFSSADMDLELTLPFFADTTSAGSIAIVNEAPKYKNVLGMVRSSYFPVPSNRELSALRDRIDVRLYQNRHGLDINGNKQHIPLFEPPIDPGQLVRSSESGLSTLSLLGDSVDGPMPNYRFLFLLQKAFDMCTNPCSVSLYGQP
ncbi:hypothetical protein ACHAQK_012315 [Fusarium lateritium]